MKLLYILNIANRVNNFSEASMLAAKEMGYEFHIAGNWGYKDDDERKDDEKKYGITIHQVDFIRMPFDIRNIKAYKQICNIIKKESIDVIHCNTPIGGVVGRIAGKHCGVKQIIYQAHGFHFYKGAPLINRTVFKWIEMLLGHWTDVIITINQEDYNAAKKFKLRNKGKVYYVPGVGIDTKLYKPEFVKREEMRRALKLEKDDIVCVSMGDLIPRKNYSIAIKAIAQCRNEKIHYLICGEGAEKNKLKKLTEDLKIEKQVHFLGFRSDVKEILQAADIFLLTTFQEGMPRSMMEAMASGLPCIASNIRGCVDLLTNDTGGFLVPTDDEKQIADKIVKLAEHKELRQKMALENLERVLEFDTEKIKKDTERLYENEIGGGVN